MADDQVLETRKAPQADQKQGEWSVPDPALSEQQTEELSTIVLVANTPTYLARRLRENGIIVGLSHASAAGLLRYGHKVLTESKKGVTLAVAAYAALVTAMMRPASEFANVSTIGYVFFVAPFFREFGEPSCRS
ncbi:MAG: hypothetical protein ABI640_15475 [Gammaproteobacteria bacterium]